MMVALFRPVPVDRSRKPCGDAGRPEQERLEVTLGRAWLWLFPAPALLCGCSQEPPDYWQGYVEGDYIYVSPAASGTLLERNVIRGDRV